MIKTIHQIKRNTDSELDAGLTDLNLVKTNEYARKYGFCELPQEEEIDAVLPYIWEYLKSVDMSELAIPNEQWQNIIQFLDYKATREM